MARLGSFAAPVDIPEHLRPWSLSGLEALYLPGEIFSSAAPAAAEPGNLARSSPEQEAPGAPQDMAHAPEFPDPWARLAVRVKTPPKVIITYAELARDVAGTGDSGRRKLFQSILAHLGWPAGTTLFWPVLHADPEAAHEVFAADIFAQGVAHFGVRHIAAFGQRTQARVLTLFPQEGKPVVLVHRLPAPEELRGLLPHDLHRALAVLKALKLA